MPVRAGRFRAAALASDQKDEARKWVLRSLPSYGSSREPENSGLGITSVDLSLGRSIHSTTWAVSAEGVDPDLLKEIRTSAELDVVVRAVGRSEALPKIHARTDPRFRCRRS